MIIFLDIDGVIATSRSYEEYPDRDDLLDRRCISALNYLADRLDAAYVISSTWRIEGITALREKLAYARLKREVIGTTPLTDDRVRGKEILEWIRINNYKGDYLVIDDEISDISPHIPEDKILHTGRNAFRGKGLTIKMVEDYLRRRNEQK